MKLDHLRLRLLPVFDIEFASVNGDKKNMRRDREFLEFRDIPSGQEFNVVISYSGRLTFLSEFTRMTPELAILHEEEVLPGGPTSLQSVRIGIVVPKNWSAVTVGDLTSQTSNGDSTQFVWECHQPIPLIGWICAGKFFEEQRKDQGISISVHLFREDSSSAQKIINLAQDVLKFYGNRFSPYRFSKLSIVEVDNWVAGRNILAVASPSFIMIKKFTFETTDRFNQVRSILPHEIAHQWWPVSVFLNDEDLAFLSEGMCEYSAKLFDEAVGMLTLRDSLGRHPLLRPLITRIARGHDVPLHQKADLRSMPTHYLKASYVHNMLRHIIGDSAFFRLYREFARRFETKRATLADFRILAEELSGRRLEWFFDEWVNNKGIPRMKVYNVKATPLNGKWRVQGRVRIVGYEKFTVSVDVGVVDSAGMKTTTVWIGGDTSGVYHNDVPFEIIAEHKPKRAFLDPNGDVLKIQRLPAKLGDLRDPGDGVMIVGTLKHKEYLAGLARKDSTEMERGGWTLVIKPDTSISLADLQNERVFLYGKASENQTARTLEQKFPLGFHGDSVVVDQEPIFDSTLALLQIIENPFMAGGLLCWVAPLSERANVALLPFDDSWVLTRGKEVISSGSWTVEDPDLIWQVK